MNKNWMKVFVIMAVFVLGIAQNGVCRDKPNLYEELSSKDEVKVYISKILDSAHAGTADEVSLKQKLEEALTARKTINFKIVSSPGEADFKLDCDIKEFVWMEEDPIDDVHGIGPAILDVAIKQNYVRMQIDFAVTDTKTNKEVWQRLLKTTITKPDMDAAASIPLANEGIVKIFIRECFNKPSGNDQLIS